MLTDRQKRFVFEYCKDFVASKAYVRAGYSERSAGQGASALLENPEVIAAIEEHKEMLASVACLTPQWVLHQWMQIASADPSEIVRTYKVPCSDCWEGMDYDARLPINPDCRRCSGTGETRVDVADVRTLSGAARRLYAGAVQTRDGIKILMRDQEGALRNLADYLSMVNRGKNELSGPGGGPISVAALVARPEDLSDEQLAALIIAELGVSKGVQPQVLLPSNTIDATLEPV